MKTPVTFPKTHAGYYPVNILSARFRRHGKDVPAGQRATRKSPDRHIWGTYSIPLVRIETGSASPLGKSSSCSSHLLEGSSVNVLIPGIATVWCEYVEAQTGAGTRIGRHGYRHRPIDCRDLDFGTEYRFVDRNR